MKYLHLYDYEHEFDPAYYGDEYLEHWVSLTQEREIHETHPDGFTIENGHTFVLGIVDDINYDYYIKSSGTTDEYNGTYFYDRYDEDYRCEVYSNGTKEVFVTSQLEEMRVSDTVNVNSDQFWKSVVTISLPDYDLPVEEQEMEVIKISGFHCDSHVEPLHRVDYDKSNYQKSLETPFTITVLENGTISFNISGRNKTINYAKNILQDK